MEQLARTATEQIKQVSATALSVSSKLPTRLTIQSMSAKLENLYSMSIKGEDEHQEWDGDLDRLCRASHILAVLSAHPTLNHPARRPDLQRWIVEPSKVVESAIERM